MARRGDVAAGRSLIAPGRLAAPRSRTDIYGVSLPDSCVMQRNMGWPAAVSLYGQEMDQEIPFEQPATIAANPLDAMAAPRTTDRIVAENLFTSIHRWTGLLTAWMMVGMLAPRYPEAWLHATVLGLLCSFIISRLPSCRPLLASAWGLFLCVPLFFVSWLAANLGHTVHWVVACGSLAVIIVLPALLAMPWQPASILARALFATIPPWVMVLLFPVR